MKKTKMFLTAILLVASTWLAKSQSCPSNSCSVPACEYICNGGFNYYSTIPNALNQLGYACGWTNSFSSYTPDYYLSTTSASSVDIPCNFHGNENFQFDDGYAGVLGRSTGW